MNDDNIVVVAITDDNRAALVELVYRDVMAEYIGKSCPYCGQQYNTIEDMGADPVMGKGRIAVHGECFYLNEADAAWRKANPHLAPKD